MTPNLIYVTLLIGYTSPVSSESDGFFKLKHVMNFCLSCDPVWL